MKVGAALRNMGEHATRDVLERCARHAEDAGLDSVWVTDHLAIPPGDAEGSGGRYLDPLATLAFLAGVTRRLGLGTGVLVLPYRPPLPTAKWVASVQELSGGRLLLGVGVGWMEAEFRALGVERGRRGALADRTLELLRHAFGSGPTDEVEWNGQRFLFRPNPPRPPIFVGGAAPHALERAARHDGWMPIGGDPARLAPHIAALRERAPHAEVVAMTSLPLDDLSAARDAAAALADAGVTRLVHGAGRVDESGFRKAVDALGAL